MIFEIIRTIVMLCSSYCDDKVTTLQSNLMKDSALVALILCLNFFQQLYEPEETGHMGYAPQQISSFLGNSSLALA